MSLTLSQVMPLSSVTFLLNPFRWHVILVTLVK